MTRNACNNIETHVMAVFAPSVCSLVYTDTIMVKKYMQGT